MKSPVNRRRSSSMIGGRTRRIIFFSAVCIIFILLLSVIKGALFPIALSLFLAYQLDPIIDYFEDRRIPRALSSVFLILVVGGLLVLAILVLIPTLQKEVTKLAENLPQFISALRKSVLPFLEKYLKIRIPVTIEGIVDEAINAAKNISPGNVKPMTAILSGAFTGLLGLLTALLAVILIPVLTYFFLKDFHALVLRVSLLIPKDVKPWLVARIREVDDVLGGFVRGQLAVCAIMAILYSIGLSVIGIDLSVLIGTVGGLGLIIPYVGAAVAVTFSVLMSIVTFGPDVHIFYILGWFGFVHLWEAYYITPTIVGQRVGLSPLGVILSLYIGGESLGVLGLLFAIPFVAILKVFFRAGMDYYLQSSFYHGR